MTASQILTCLFRRFVLTILFYGYLIQSYMPPISSGNFIWDLYGSGADTTDFANMLKAWTLVGFTTDTNKISICTTVSGKQFIMLRGDGIITSSNGLMERTYYGLSQHDMVYYSLMIIMIGPWQTSDSFTVQIGGKAQKTYYLSSETSRMSTTTCGSSGTVGSQAYIVGSQSHSTSDITVKISFSISNGLSFAVKDVVMTFAKTRNFDAERKYFATSSVSNNADSTPCPKGYFSFSSGSCQPCNSACFLCFGPTSAQCYSPVWLHYFSGTDFPNIISSGCELVSADDPGICLRCSSGKVLDVDNTCNIACSGSLIPLGQGASKVCTTPCPIGQFRMLDNTCSTSCSLPMTVATYDQYEQTCLSSCGQSIDWYLNYNGSCVQSCALQGVNKNNNLLCVPCTNINDYLYENGSCLTTCRSDFRAVKKFGYNFCNYPCPSGEYLYPDKTCQSSCSGLFQKRSESIYQFCDFSCGSLGVDYYYPDQGRCRVGCSYPYVIQSVATCKLDLSESDLKASNAVSDTTEALDKPLNIAAALASLLSSDDPGAFGLVSLSKMIFYTKYMDLKYPPKLQAVLNKQLTNKTSLKIIGEYRATVQHGMTDYPIPEKFAQYWLHSSFLINFWQTLLYICAMLLVILILYLLSFPIKKCTKLGSVFQSIRNIIQWNFFFAFVMGEFDGIILYSSLDLRTNYMTSNSLLGSMVVLILINTIALIIIIASVVVIVRIRKEAKISRDGGLSGHVDDLLKRLNAYKAIFSTFEDSSWSQHLFFFIYSLRICVFHIIIAYMFQYPLAQTILILCVNIATVAYLSIKRPVKAKFKLAQYISQECLLLIVNIGVLTIAILDLMIDLHKGFRRAIGDAILICNILFKAIGVLSMSIQVYIVLRDAYHGRKKNNRVDTFQEEISLTQKPNHMPPGSLVSSANSSSTILSGNSFVNDNSRSEIPLMVQSRIPMLDLSRVHSNLNRNNGELVQPRIPMLDLSRVHSNLNRNNREHLTHNKDQNRRADSFQVGQGQGMEMMGNSSDGYQLNQRADELLKRKNRRARNN